MKHLHGPSQTDYQPSESFNQRLHVYSAAACAAGVGLFALTQPAAGEIVYTPADITISVQKLHSYALDLNNDGTTDFFINATSRESVDQSGGTTRIVAKPAQNSNGVAGYGINAVALKAGQPIGSPHKFSGFFMASVFTFIGTEFNFRGQWANVKDRYLGLKFQIDGQTHYGWARLTVGEIQLTAELTGYAYETTPNTPIVAGKTSGTAAAVAPVNMPGTRTDALGATLGALALGAPSLEVWRREEQAAHQIA
jgi:hypothetical protein